MRKLTIQHAAVHRSDGPIITGRSHPDIIKDSPYGTCKAGSKMGFITSDGNFVDRDEALKIALESDQINKDMDTIRQSGLISENIWADCNYGYEPQFGYYLKDYQDKVKWLIEDYEHDSSLQPLMDEIKKQGMEYKIVSYEPWESGVFDQFPNEDCVVFYGTLNLGKQLCKQKGWIPGVYCNWQNLCCVTYYSYWARYLFNKDYIMLPLLEIKRRQEEIYEKFGVDDCIFIRPDSGAKTFTGQILKKEEIDKEFKLFESYAGKPLDQIYTIISSPKLIDKEWRFVVVDGTVLAQSQYRDNVEGTIRGQNGEIEPVIKEGSNIGAHALACVVANDKWQPDRAYTLDICQQNDSFFLLEVNSFSCSGLYECNPEHIVRKISTIALEEWKDYNEVPENGTT